MDTLEEIIKYVDKEMSDEEMISFEQRITKDSTIRNSVNIASEVVKLLEDQKYFDFLNKLQEAQSLFQSKQPEEVDILTEKTAAEPRRFSFNWQPFAALIAGVIIVGSVWLFYNHSQPFNERLYKEYYTKYEANVQTRSSDNDNNDLIKAIEFYDHGNYTEAIAYFKKILQLDASNIAAHFFIGVSYMETKSFADAINNLTFVIAQQDTVFEEHAEWYMALCYLRTNQTKLALNILKKISTSKNYYKQMASDLLKKIN